MRRFAGLIVALLLFAVIVATAAHLDNGVSVTDYNRVAGNSVGSNWSNNGWTIVNGSLANFNCYANCTGFGNGSNYNATYDALNPQGQNISRLTNTPLMPSGWNIYTSGGAGKQFIIANDTNIARGGNFRSFTTGGYIINTVINHSFLAAPILTMWDIVCGAGLTCVYDAVNPGSGQVVLSSTGADAYPLNLSNNSGTNFILSSNSSNLTATRTAAGNWTIALNNPYYPSSSSSGAYGAYSVYITNSSNTYNAYSSTGQLLYTDTGNSGGWDVMNKSMNTSGAKWFYLKAGTNIKGIPLAENIIGASSGGNITVVGEDWNIIAVENPATNFLGASPGTSVMHVKIQDAFADDPKFPAGSERKLQYFSNMRRISNVAFANYDSMFGLIMQGETGTDSPAYAVINYGSGDTYYAQLQNKPGLTGMGGTGVRIDDYSANYNQDVAGGIQIYDLNYTAQGAGKRYYFRVTNATDQNNISALKYAFTDDGAQIRVSLSANITSRVYKYSIGQQRALDITYWNMNGTTLAVMVSAYGSAASEMVGYINGIQVTHSLFLASSEQTTTIIVPPGANYSFRTGGGGPVIEMWVETEIGS